jgi:multidrug efflux pump subunit AcrA (membrane-fusion protein)
MKLFAGPDDLVRIFDRDRAEQLAGRMVVRAGVDGTAIERLADVGDMVTAGQTLARISASAGTSAAAITTAGTWAVLTARKTAATTKVPNTR